MKTTVDQDLQWLINCLNAILDSNHQVRSFAETSLQQASLQPGYGGALSRVAASRELPLGLRQLAAVLLKQFIKKHWQEDEVDFEHPVVSSDEKEAIRHLLLSLIDDPHRKMCTAISMAVASISHYDWPEDWPDLLPTLINSIMNQTKANTVHGALRCLALLSVDLDDKMVPQLVPVLFPFLHTIVSSPQIYDKALRTKALSIVYACISMLGTMSGVYKTETTALLSPMLQPWINQFTSILEQPVPSEDPDDWSIRMEVLKCLNQSVQNFPGLMEGQFMVIMGPLWQTFVSSLRVYIQASVEGMDDAYEGRYDSDGAEQSLESFVIQLFEFMLTILGSKRFVKVIVHNLEELAYCVIAFLQITEQQQSVHAILDEIFTMGHPETVSLCFSTGAHTWMMDANQFLADEEDNTYSCRASGALLLEEVINSCGPEGINAIIKSSEKRFNESQQEKTAGSPSWWRIREATLFALASVSEQLLETEDSEKCGATLGNILEKVLVEDIATGVDEYPFLYARMFSSVAKFSSVISRGINEQFVYAAVKAIGMDVPPPVKAGACRALSHLLTDADSRVIWPHIKDLISSLTNLLEHTSDETMHLVLETLQAAVRAGPELLPSVESILSPIILNVWASHVTDPFASIDALEVLEAIKTAPGCIQPLVSRILPYVGQVLTKPQQQPEGLVAGSLDLLTMLLKDAPIDVIKAICEVSFDPVIRIILQSDDHSEMQNATQCLSALVYGAKQELLGWGGDPGFTMNCLLDVTSRLLNPDLESSVSLFVGSYILQLILHLPSQMAQHIRDLVAALIRRMQYCEISALKSSLLLIFARLVHMSVPHVEQFINLLLSLPAEGHKNAFAYLMFEWTKMQGEIQGAYQIKVTTSALALLLSTRHVELEKIDVQGNLIKHQSVYSIFDAIFTMGHPEAVSLCFSTGSSAGITTRSKAKTAPDQWTVMPLPVKILAILADSLVEIREQASVDGDEDDDWEEAEGGDIGRDEAVLISAVPASNSRPNYQYLDAMAKAFNEDQDDGYDDDLHCSGDPLYEINLVNYLTEFLQKFSISCGAHLPLVLKSLTKSQQEAILMALSH